MFRVKRVLIALLLAGLVMGLLGYPYPLWADEFSTIDKITFQIDGTSLMWTPYHGGPLGIVDAHTFRLHSSINNDWLLFDVPDFLGVVKTSESVYIFAFRGREMGNLRITKGDWITEFRTPFVVKGDIIGGYYRIGSKMGGDYDPLDVEQGVKVMIKDLRLSLDTNGNWNKGYYWGPQDLASAASVISWLGTIFGGNTPKSPSPKWQENSKAAEIYFADLGYEYAGSGNIKYPFNNSLSVYQFFAMFTGLDKALWAGIVNPQDITSQLITRADFALFAARAAQLSLSSVDISNIPWDLKDPKWKDYLPAIQAMLDRGYLKLFPDGSFYPEGNMTREEVVRILYAIKENNPSFVPFPTITPSRPYLTLNFPVQSPIFFKNGQGIPMDVTPTIVQGRTFLPIRYLAEALGAQVEWDQEKVTITTTAPYIKIDGSITTATATTIELWVGTSTARVNGTDVPIDPGNPSVVPFVLPPGRTMLPLRFVSESLGAKVYWLQETEEVLVIWEPPALLKEQSLPPP